MPLMFDNDAVTMLPLQETVDKEKYRVAYQSPWPNGDGLVMVKDLPFAAGYLGDMFDLATNQPEGMDFSLHHTALERWACWYTWVYTYVTQKEKAECQCQTMIPSEQFSVQTLSLQIYNILLFYTVK